MAAIDLVSIGGESVDVVTLGDLALFSSLDDHTLSLLADRLAVRTLPADMLVFEEGDPGRAMYVVLAGSVELLKRNDAGDAMLVAVAREGDWFGELCLLDVMTRPVTARAAKGTRLLAISPTDLAAVYRSSAKMYALLVMNLARQLSRKLRAAELSLACALGNHGHR